MNKWKRYRKIQIVDVLQFNKPENPKQPQYPIEVERCSCDAMDRFNCPQHRKNPIYYYEYHAIDRYIPIRIGEYLIRFNNGQAMTVSSKEFGEQYEEIDE